MQSDHSPVGVSEEERMTKEAIMSEQIKRCAQRLESHLKRMLSADYYPDERDNVEGAAYRVVEARCKLLFAAKLLEESGL